MKDFTHDIVDKIKKGEIKQESQWRFLAHDYFFWLLTGASIVFGSSAIASILHKISIEQIAPLKPHFEREAIPVFVQTLPYLWILVFIGLLFVAWFNYKRTSLSYRRHNGTIVLGVLAISLLLGGVLFAFGVGKHVDERVRKHVPLFERQFEQNKELRDAYILERERRKAIKRELGIVKPPKPPTE